MSAPQSTFGTHRLKKFDGVTEDLNKEPVAMFTLANGDQVGMSMEELGDFVERHREILRGGRLSQQERADLRNDQRWARTGADEIAARYNMLLDDRLRPDEEFPELRDRAVTETVKTYVNGLMARIGDKPPTQPTRKAGPCGGEPT